MGKAKSHIAGDEALKTVAKTLSLNFALSKGDFVARHDGDKFMIVCHNMYKQLISTYMMRKN